MIQERNSYSTLTDFKYVDYFSNDCLNVIGLHVSKLNR